MFATRCSVGVQAAGKNKRLNLQTKRKPLTTEQHHYDRKNKPDPGNFEAVFEGQCPRDKHQECRNNEKQQRNTKSNVHEKQRAVSRRFMQLHRSVYYTRLGQILFYRQFPVQL